jgi:pimeloyl-ACP methyl ester carboxylesterase
MLVCQDTEREDGVYLWPEIASGALRLSYVDAGGIRTRYAEAGNPSDDEAVVFVPGTGGHPEAFIRNLLPHGERYRSIALDMIGHGYSDKPDHDYEIRHYVKHLLAFSNALGLKRIHLHGESLGGWIAAQFAIEHPERVATLTLNTAGGLNTDPAVMQRVYTVTMKAVAEASPATVRARLEWLMNDPRRTAPCDLHSTRLPARDGAHPVPTEHGYPDTQCADRKIPVAYRRTHFGDLDRPRSDRPSCDRRTFLRGNSQCGAAGRDAGLRALAAMGEGGRVQPPASRFPGQA